MQIVVSNIAVEYDGTPVLTQVDFAVRVFLSLFTFVSHTLDK